MKKRKAPPAPLTPLAAGYIRQSRIDPALTDADIEALAADRQKDLQAKAESEGLVIARWYQDLDLSGTSVEKRDAFLDLLEAVKAGEITHLFAADSSRLFRNLREQEVIFWDVLEPAGVKVIFTQEPSVEDRVIGTFLRQQMGSAHELLAALTGRKVSEKRRRLAEAGLYCGGPLPVGLVWDKQAKRLVASDQANLAREVFRLFALHQNGRVAALALNQAGHRFKGGTEWDGGDVLRTVRSSYFRGLQPFGGQVYPIAAEAVIPAETLAAVDAILSTWSYSAGGRSNASRTGPLSGRLRCRLCGAALSRKIADYPTQRWVAYACHTRQHGGLCEAKALSERRLLLACREAVLPWLQAEKARLAKAMDAAPPPVPVRPAPAPVLAKLYQRRQRLLKMLLDVDEADSQYPELQALRQSLNEQIRRAEAAPAPVEPDTPHLPSTTFCDQLTTAWQEVTALTREEQRALVEALELVGETDGETLWLSVFGLALPPVAVPH